MSKKDLQIDYGGRSDNKVIYRANGNRRSFCLTGSPLDSQWSRNSEEYLRLTEEDNGLTVQFSDSSKPIKLNYMQAELIRLALKINDPTPQLSEIVVRKFKKFE